LIADQVKVSSWKVLKLHKDLFAPSLPRRHTMGLSMFQMGSCCRQFTLIPRQAAIDVLPKKGAQQYLFPRFKFLDQGWMEHDPGKKKSFSAFVQRKLKIRPGTQFADEWDNIIAPAIVKKYTDMRCNVNNAVRRTFIGEYRDICVLCSFTILLIWLCCQSG